MIPFYVGGQIAAPKNHHSKTGAERLARHIEMLWLRQGFRVNTRIEQVGVQEDFWVVRSDMKNGMPRWKSS